MSQAVPLLEISRLSMVFGGVVALNGVGTRVESGQIKGLIGPNGAGKTTLFNVISGLLAPSSGDVLLAGTSLVGREPHMIAGLGVTRTFQNVRLFERMSVLENVMVGQHMALDTGFMAAAMRTRRTRREEVRCVHESMQLLEKVNLKDRAEDPATDLPFGLQRTLEIARALATRPRLMLLDEPAAGLTAPERRRLGHFIRSIRDEGTTVVLIEHDMEFVMGIVDDLLVLDHGSVIAEGPPGAIQKDKAVIGAYLGTPEE